MKHSDVRQRLAGWLLHDTRSVVDELFPSVPERFGGEPSAQEKLGLPMLTQEEKDLVYHELHRIAVRVVNPDAVFSDEEVDERLLDEEVRAKT